MPELPEVETIVRGLRKRVVNLEFSRIEILLPKCIRGSDEGLRTSLRGRKILSLARRGKNIVFHLSGGAALVVHLRMTGQLRLAPRRSLSEKHTHLIFSFKRHPEQLRFIDPRQFGRIFLESKEGGDALPSLMHLGPDPLEISAPEFIRRLRARQQRVKPLLLDQNFLAGVGNIYADEALYRAGIHPRRKAATIKEREALALFQTLRRILRAAIRAGGTSVRSYVDSSGSPGGFQNFLRVYRREGEACRDCGTAIVRDQVGGRSTFFCPRCQRQ